MDGWLDFARGPLLRICLAIMVLGLARHFLLTLLGLWLSQRRAGDRSLPWKKLARRTGSWLLPVGRLREQLPYGVTSLAFHLGLLITPLFLAGHVTLLERTLGLSWPFLPALAADILTLLMLAAGAMLIGIRLGSRHRRQLSQWHDYCIPFCVMMPFAFGFMAMHPAVNPFPYEGALLLHLLSAELVMVLAPMTKLSHIAIMPLAQLVAAVGWKWPAAAGSTVGRDLGREDQPL